MSPAPSLASLLAGELPRGVYRLASRYDGEQVERIALDAGWLFAPVWGTGTKRETLAAIGEALGFGDEYGRNLDALNDCLRDLVGRTVMLWVDWAGLAEKDPDAMRAILHVLGESELLAVVLAGQGPDLDGVPVLES
jgi:RNAse (barnase) inhibitor barstar